MIRGGIKRKRTITTTSTTRCRIRWTLGSILILHIMVTLRVASLLPDIKVAGDHVFVCMDDGDFYGQTFNRFISLARAWEYTQTTGDGQVLVANHEHLTWYHEWLDLPSTIRAQNAADTCTIRLNYQQWYRFHFGAEVEGDPVRSMDNNSTNNNNKGYQPSFDLLRAAFKESFQQEAAQRLRQYRQQFILQQQQHMIDFTAIHSDDIRVVTVHSRNLENECLGRIRMPVVFCAGSLSPDILQHLEPTCGFTQSYVRGHLPAESFPRNQTMILLFADGQLHSSNRHLTISTMHPFRYK